MSQHRQWQHFSTNMCVNFLVFPQSVQHENFSFIDRNLWILLGIFLLYLNGVNATETAPLTDEGIQEIVKLFVFSLMKENFFFSF